MLTFFRVHFGESAPAISGWKRCLKNLLAAPQIRPTPQNVWAISLVHTRSRFVFLRVAFQGQGKVFLRCVVMFSATHNIRARWRRPWVDRRSVLLTFQWRNTSIRSLLLMCCSQNEHKGQCYRYVLERNSCIAHQQPHRLEYHGNTGFWLVPSLCRQSFLVLPEVIVCIIMNHVNSWPTIYHYWHLL